MTATPKLYGVQIERTLRCNLRCAHCGAAAGSPRPDELETYEVLRLVDEIANLGAQEVCLLGGEPLLAPDWEDLARACGDRGMQVVLITNGWLIDGPLAARIRAIPNLDRVGVSLDAANEAIHDRIRGVSGAFQRAVGAIRALRDAGVETGAITTVSKQNVEELAGLRDMLLGEDITWQIQIASFHGGSRFSRDLVISEREFYGIGRFIAETRASFPPDRLPVAGSHDIGYFSGRFPYTGELPGWSGCPGGLYTLGITSDGGVKGCLAQSNEFIEGNVREETLEAIWSDPARFRRNRAFSPDLLEGSCRGCEHGAACRGGCADKAASLSGSVYCDPYCFHRLERDGIV
ncbi:MAG: radical SAM protein [Planctomycetes bacterium]|nr:radical SAM protein [Planctomycetota bacterium]